MTNEKKTLLTRIAVGAAVCVVGIGVRLGVSSSMKSQVKANQNTIQELRTEMEQARVDQLTKENDLKITVKGLDTTRVERDQTKLDDFLKKLCTWSGKEAYTSVRTEMLEQYPENDAIEDFFPDAESMTDDQTFNMTYVSCDLDVVNIADGTYSYFVTVKISTDASEEISGTGTFLMTCDVNEDGTIVNPKPYALNE